MAGPARYVPAAGHPALTRLYDPLLAITMREGAWRPRLVEQVAQGGPATVLEVGCGTGTLTLALADALPAAEVTGLDGDPEALGIARAKAGAQTRVRWLEGMAQGLPFADAAFDRVVVSLVLHHLVPAVKRQALGEIRRVLRPGGRLHVADFGAPGDPLMAVAFRALQLFDGREPTRDHAAGRLPSFLQEAGLGPVSVTGRLRTASGRLELLVAGPGAG
jgi:ubiquinone/menaquinone biosynthesis C-methylase UbiE